MLQRTKNISSLAKTNPFVANVINARKFSARKYQTFSSLKIRTKNVITDFIKYHIVAFTDWYVPGSTRSSRVCTNQPDIVYLTVTSSMSKKSN